jgi:hypothetical protein
MRIFLAAIVADQSTDDVSREPWSLFRRSVCVRAAKSKNMRAMERF